MRKDTQLWYDVGMTITCGGCGVKQNFYLDTHSGTRKGYMAGQCSNCNQMLSAKIVPNDDLIFYERGPIPYGEYIQPKDNEDDYEWGGERA